MNYKAICEQNQSLYGQLEQLTVQITFCIANNLMDDVDMLQGKKEGLRSLINANLEKIDEIWYIESRTHRS